MVNQNPKRKLSLSSWILIISNFVPLWGVLFLGWNTLVILLLFWTENLMIGFFNILKMAIVKTQGIIGIIPKIFLIPFFAFHYGMFTFIHGAFVIGFFGRSYVGNSFPTPDVFLKIVKDNNLYYAMMALFISHSFSFIYNYIIQEEYKKVSLDKLMAAPYARVVILHLTIIAGGFLLMASNSPVGGLVILIILKMLFDIKAHNKEHDLLSPIKKGERYVS